ncbi:1-aminocyclopropane-1-carboxylate oxidase -like protein [Capsicum baccatum]|uniref:1-aminocyclopropane-1-carboxylate oxidase-like protein n=1 Tax=Capsicum baccatum TaxID=33114 RepID=A0A2G2UXL6_CAPBA|nr:1-aminocyclopropane-1-carboxylate oxidase -like protein [Capsicum baccatum]
MDTSESKHDRKSELEAFDDTKAGVKGLVDAGISKVPQIFISPPNTSTNNSNPTTGQFIFPVIDLQGINDNQINRKKVVEEVRDASETWGFFQVINHGIPSDVLEEMIRGARSFHEQNTEIKKKWYTREFTKKVVYNSNFDLYSAPATNWRDTFFCIMAPNPPSFEELPQICRDIIVKYSEEVKKLGRCLFELLAEALGLNTSHLKDMDCDKGLSVVCHYYPACPEPELTLGASEHADDGFLTLLLQDHIGGLQVLHDNRWVDVPPTPGALVVNIADLLQAELQAFDETKAGVKGLVDAGITKVPRIFVQPSKSEDSTIDSNKKFSFPVVDLDGIKEDPTKRKKIQDTEVKKQWYTRDLTKEFTYNSNFDLFKAPVTNWRDTFTATIAPIPPNRDILPSVCRDILLEYTNQVMELGDTLFELLSEAIGLEPNHLKDMGCSEGLMAFGHYYPACPQPELTLGTSMHADNDFLTVLLQDNIGGLLVLHQNHWVDVPPTPGALVVNIGDILQASSGTFKHNK